MGNVIEVDFIGERIDRLPLSDQIQANHDRLEAKQRRLEEALEGVAANRDQLLDFAFARIRKLERQLRAAQPVTEQDVLRSLKRVHAGEPVSAAAVTAAMYAAPQHSTVIRVGLALSSLSRTGAVRRFEPEYGGHAAACRWEPSGA